MFLFKFPFDDEYFGLVLLLLQIVAWLDNFSRLTVALEVEEARLDSCSRNLYRHEDLKLAVDIEKVL